MKPRHYTIVIKLGTSSICDEKTHEPLISNLSLIVETCVKLRREGHRVVIVSSGAIGIGLRRLDIEKRPKQLAAVQVCLPLPALGMEFSEWQDGRDYTCHRYFADVCVMTFKAIAAVGQCRLIALWDELFKQLRQPVAQILMTRNDIADRTQYLNACNTFAELLNTGVIPIVNENDTLAVSEIKFGDNDTLSAITAGMVNADYLFLMTDVDCLYTNNPRTHPDAKPIEVVEDISALEVDVSTAGSSVGTGGMATKLIAARLATSAGVTTIITRSSTPSNIFHIVKYIQSLPPTPGAKTPSRHSGAHTPSGNRSADSADPVHLISALRTHTPRPATPGATTTSSTTTTTKPQQPPLPPCPLHTRFLPQHRAIRDRHFWILHGLKPHGIVYIDQGAYNALTRHDKAGLLPVGVVGVEGSFAQQEAVSLVVVKRTPGVGKGFEVINITGIGEAGVAGGKVEGEVGRALVNYSAVEIGRIMGHKSSEIQALLGYADTEYVAHRDNTAFFPERSMSSTDLKNLVTMAEKEEIEAQQQQEAEQVLESTI